MRIVYPDTKENRELIESGQVASGADAQAEYHRIQSDDTIPVDDPLPVGGVNKREDAADEKTVIQLIDKFREIVAFLPMFETSGFEFGHWVQTSVIEPGLDIFPYCSLSDGASAFIETAYRSGLVLSDFDWPAWMQTEEAKMLSGDAAALKGATPEQLARLLTVCIRQDRFAEGSLLSAFRSGLLIRILQRATAILAG